MEAGSVLFFVVIGLAIIALAVFLLLYRLCYGSRH